MEERKFLITAYNNNDDSIFPALTFDGNQTLNWTFTADAQFPEPAYWLVEKSPDGNVWTTQESLATLTRTANILATGTQYWRVMRSNDGISGLDPESNIVKAVVV